MGWEAGAAVGGPGAVPGAPDTWSSNPVGGGVGVGGTTAATTGGAAEVGGGVGVGAEGGDPAALTSFSTVSCSAPKLLCMMSNLSSTWPISERRVVAWTVKDPPALQLPSSFLILSTHSA